MIKRDRPFDTRFMNKEAWTCHDCKKEKEEVYAIVDEVSLCFKCFLAKGAEDTPYREKIIVQPVVWQY